MYQTHYQAQQRYRRTVCPKCGQDMTRFTQWQTDAHKRRHASEDAAFYDFILGAIAIIAGGIGVVLIPYAVSAVLNHSPRATPAIAVIVACAIAFYWLIMREAKPDPTQEK